jgi:flavin reductase ActVB
MSLSDRGGAMKMDRVIATSDTHAEWNGREASVAPETYREAFRLHAEGVTVVTATDEFGDQIGMTATSVTSLSLEPPLLLVCINRRSRMTSTLISGACFVVHLLASDQEVAANLFARPLADKFEQVSYAFTSSGCPRLRGALASLECTGHDAYEAGDHIIVVGRVIDVHVNREREAALVSFDGHLTRLELRPSGGTTQGPR